MCKHWLRWVCQCVSKQLHAREDPESGKVIPEDYVHVDHYTKSIMVAPYRDFSNQEGTTSPLNIVALIGIKRGYLGSSDLAGKGMI